MGADAKSRLQMLRVHEKAGKLIFVEFQAKEYADPHIVNSRCHSPVHGLCVIAVVVLRPSGVKSLIALPVVSFLEQDVSSDSCLF